MRSVRLVRLLLAMTALDPHLFCRSLDSFSVKSAGVIVEFDASLKGVGVIWYSLSSSGEECPLGALSVDISSMGFGDDSQFQNAAEFIAATVGILGLLCLGLRGSLIRLRGDSKSALCWASSLRFKGCRTMNAAIVFTLFLIQGKFTIVNYVQLTSAQNVRTDELSRGTSIEELRERFVDLRHVNRIKFPFEISEVLELCNPFLTLEDDSSFITLWRNVHSVVSRASSSV
jgi:hypothetical protein